ncbi:MAG TPA: DnaA/Hda family protein [Gemmatimonadales bacterium]|nr:DnaA/Hda family protein [Gemmatimonadales bacterium]
MELNPRFRFESFVVGASNRLAATAARTVAESPGTSYNPLFLYAKSGLGKTHLLQAIGFLALERQAKLRVEYLTLEEFVERYHAAVAAGQVEAFRRSALETDLLLLDDVQFLAEHREMQAELLRVTEALQAAERQIVLTCDRPPSEIADLDERLVTRLSGGLLVDIAAPDFETRLAILHRKVTERGAEISQAVLETVAEVGATSVRELIGLVNRLIAFQAVGGGELTPEAARTLLADELPAPAKPPAPPPAAPAPAPAAGAAPDEFASFLSAISTTVAQTVDAWRSRIGEAVLRWQGEGFRTTRLEQLLLSEEIPDVGSALADYAARAQELQRLVDEAASFDPAAAGNPVFHDPDRIEEARAFAERVKAGVEPPPPPSRGLSFAEFIEGKANEAAVRAAREVVREPGKRFNPLFVTGPSGSGKTHLLHAVGNALAAERPEVVVACLSAQSFTDELVQAINAGRIEWWRRRFRRADALILDDVQLLSGRDATQEELFNLFNAFADAEKQLAFSADRLPGQLTGIAPRLTTRFEGGLAVELAPPDRTMRAEMVRRLLAARNVVAEVEAVEYLAARPADSARAVQGLVNRALARMDPSSETLTVQAARLAIEGRAVRPSQAQAVSAVVPAGLDAVMGSREKVVWDWPGATERLVEELR